MLILMIGLHYATSNHLGHAFCGDERVMANTTFGVMVPSGAGSCAFFRNLAPIFWRDFCDRRFFSPTTKTTRSTNRNAWSSMRDFNSRLYDPPQNALSRKVQPISTSCSTGLRLQYLELPMTRPDFRSTMAKAPFDSIAPSKNASKTYLV